MVLIVAIVLVVAIAIVLSIQHDVDVEIEGEGTVEPSHASVHLFGTAEFKIVPAEGYVISEVLVDGESTEVKDGVLRLTHIVGDHKVRVTFSPSEKYQLNMTSEGNGTVSPSTGMYAEGEKVDIGIAPDDGYVISDVSIDGKSVGSINRLSIVMDSDHSVHVTFRDATASDPVVDVSVDVRVGTVTGAFYGDISPSGPVRVAYGGSLVVTISLNEGYVLSSVVVDGKEMGTSSIVTVTNIIKDVNIDITVLSKSLKTYTITSSSTSGGSISPSGAITMIEGDSATFTMTADSGYHLSSLIVDGTSLSYSGSTYTFANVTADHTISAVFATDPSPGPTPPSPKTLDSISLSNYPTTCVVNQTLVTSGMIVTAHWSDGSISQVTEYSVSPTSFSETGQKTVTVTYQGKTATFQVNVTEAQYTVTFTASTGGSVSKSSITVSSGTIPGVSGDNLVFGTITVTPTADSKKYIFGSWSRSDGGDVTSAITADVTFTASFFPLTSISVKTQPTKVSYFAGETFDSTGMEIQATHSLGSESKIVSVDLSECTFSPSGALKTTDTSITVTWQDKTCTQTISVSSSFVTNVISIGDTSYSGESISQLSPISISDLMPGDTKAMVVKVTAKKACDPYLMLYKLNDSSGLADYITVTYDTTTVRLSDMPRTVSPDEAGKIALGHWDTDQYKEISIIIGFSGDTPSTMMGKSLSFTLGIGIWQDP